MARSDKRKARFVRTQLFIESFHEHYRYTASIEERLRDFIKAKEQRPPDKFANEHPLNPPFDGLRECHLAGDSCLVFKDKGDIVQLLCICTHDELRGKKAKALAKRLKARLE